MKMTALRHITVTLLKTSDKLKILKAARKKKKTGYIQSNKDKDDKRFLMENKQNRNCVAIQF